MDAAEVRTADIIGVSMGGMIAQELAIGNPGRVNRLTLGCTHCGGLKAVRAEWEILLSLASPFIQPEVKLRRMVPFLYHPDTPREMIQQDIEIIRRHPPKPRAFVQQLSAIVAWHSWNRLPQIKAETLIIHGEKDRLIPPANALILAERIPNARVIILPHAGHMFATDQPELTRKALLDFLAGYAKAG
jgi:pimeloyl-ACP methyl ester carboxylesterase